MNTGGNARWAKVPAWIAELDLDATALRVLVVLSSHAGRSGIAWVGQQAIADAIGKNRRTVGHALGRLERVGAIERAGRHVVDHERGTWTQEYRLVFERSGDPMDTQDVQRVGVPDGHDGGPDGHMAGTRWTPRVSRNRDKNRESEQNGIRIQTNADPGMPKSVPALGVAYVPGMPNTSNAPNGNGDGPACGCRPKSPCAEHREQGRNAYHGWKAADIQRRAEAVAR